MEVHQHTHTTRRKWTHYFWEFLMLFLAVFCGFLAEYQLEHKIEKNREYQYMRGFIDDLTVDTGMLGFYVNFTSNMINGLDSLLENLYDTDNALKNTHTLYRQSFNHIRIPTLNFSDHTSTQLRNSGSLRLIRNKATAHHITEYWDEIARLRGLNEIVERRANEIFTAGSHIFNSKYCISSVIDSATRKRFVTIDPGAKLMTMDSNILINYSNFIYRFRLGIDNFLKPELIAQRTRAINLLNLIKKEYHLK
jgi:hypothetical protein